MPLHTLVNLAHGRPRPRQGRRRIQGPIGYKSEEKMVEDSRDRKDRHVSGFGWPKRNVDK
ncbi:hypothetical protein N7520_010500 [Penicillium odoratum]|uniref:uncharacterized protein n=1 Tax=Penicillium odoratum TaxID=1167516 RepID=UPI002547F41E|nr:uncharacterized protein N7520_010500 [Penicillium odoratum]KAJ5745318.1 hypothetical protein N7520_010500 [Penicillium odoratum]